MSNPIETGIANKMVSENECRMLALLIARFVCEQENEDDDLPCDRCFDFAYDLVYKVAAKKGCLPVDLNTADVQAALAPVLKMQVISPEDVTLSRVETPEDIKEAVRKMTGQHESPEDVQN